MAYGESNGDGHVSRDRSCHVTLKGRTPDPNTIRVQYLENSWRHRLATIAITYWIICWEAVWSAILATDRLPVFYRAMHFSAKRGIAIACRLSVRPSVCLSVTLVNCDHIG